MEPVIFSIRTCLSATILAGLLFLSLASAIPAGNATSLVSKREPKYSNKCVGQHNTNGPPGFWVCIEAVWLDEYVVDITMKVHDSQRERPTDMQVAGSYALFGKGVKKEGITRSNTLGYGKDVITGLTNYYKPFGSSKRILSIEYQGVRAPAPTPIINKGVIRNPHIYPDAV
ncbi:hypothetical protein LTR56_023018 [Elasticomyces elasticus]|nr:hypothetical protein LTR56_023018 [Elasticomyces elasticus]KAK3668124.1 hypothetical protein LTR22_001195 [Elasticomyces elasticus]KAK4925272.1 hypothetical protein LTR49_007813 [Elasticomyces elasticus]KAK5752873.1 hypothetical protein LTS12_017044 [Elasticomyces elasticus]